MDPIKLINIIQYQDFLYQVMYLNKPTFEIKSAQKYSWSYKAMCLNVREYSEDLENYLKEHKIKYQIEEI